MQQTVIFLAMSIDDCLHLFRYASLEDFNNDCRETLSRDCGFDDVCRMVGAGNQFIYTPRLGADILYISNGCGATRVVG